jgi:hypothetical protein
MLSISLPILTIWFVALTYDLMSVINRFIHYFILLKKVEFFLDENEEENMLGRSATRQLKLCRGRNCSSCRKTIWPEFIR